MLVYLNLEEMAGRWIVHLAGWPGGFANAETRSRQVAMF